MMSICCFDHVFSLEGPSQLADFLARKGFSSDKSTTREPLVSFRVEGSEQLYTLYQEDVVVVNQQPLPLLSEVLASRLHSLVAAESPEWTFVRANVVKTPREGAILVTGPSLTGKSYLTNALLETRGEIWSRYFAVVSDSGEILPYPSASIPEEKIGVGAILNLVYRPNTECSVESQSPGQAAMHLLNLVVGSGESIAKALPRLAAACKMAGVRVKGQRGEAKQAISASLFQIG